MLGFIWFIIMGGVIGWLASMAMRTDAQQGVLLNVVVGIVGAFIGGLLIAQAYRLCEAGLAAPFEYGAVPLAILWGTTIFGEWPDGTAWIGIALICGAGLFVFWREAVAARRT